MTTNSPRPIRRVRSSLGARVALGLTALFAACDVYDSQLISTAVGTGGTGFGGSGGSASGAAGRGTGGGGSAGTLVTGGGAGVSGASGGVSGGGSAGSGGAGANGGTGMEGGSDGDGGEEPGVGGSAGMGGNSGGNAGGAAGDAGTSGTSGAGASGSGAGGAGAGGGGAGSGGAGTGGMGAGTGGAGTGGMGTTCPGCARLSVPLTASANRAHFTLLLPGSTDLSAATITFRVAKVAGTGGTFKGYIQEGNPNFRLQDGVNTTIASMSTGMQNISWSIAGAGTAANKATIQRIGIEIAGTGGSSWTNPTVLHVDSIVVTGSSLNPASYTFDTDATVSTTPAEQGPVGLLYLNSHSGDTNVTGAAVSWLGP